MNVGGATAAGGQVVGLDAGVAGITAAAGAAGGATAVGGMVSPDAGVDVARADLAPITPDAAIPDSAVIPPADGGLDIPVLPPDALIDAASPDGAAPGDASTTEGGVAPGGCPAARWNKLINVTSLTALDTDKDGNLFAAMTVYSIDPNDALDLGSDPVTSAGGADLGIAKLDPSTGSAVWTKTFGDAQDQAPVRLAVAKSGQVGVIGVFTGSMTVGNAITNSAVKPVDFIVAVDGSGTGLWAKAIDTIGGQIIAIASNPAQDAFAICGYTLGAATTLVPGATAPSDGLNDILVAKINATTGAILWSRQIGGVGKQICNAVAMDAAGNVYASGIYNGTLDLGPGAFSPAPDVTTLAVWVAKLDAATGTGTLAKSWGGAAKQQVWAVALDGAGNLAIAGMLRGAVPFGSFTLTTAGSGGDSPVDNTDAFAVKLDASFNPLWARNWGDTSDQDVRSAAFDPRGDLIVGGYLKGTIDMGNGGTLTAATGVNSVGSPKGDAFWMKVEGDTGAVLCGQRYGDDLSQQTDQIVMSNAVSGPQAGAITMAGNFSGIMDFGLGQLIAGVPGTSSETTRRTFLVQLAP
jgi:hypothetical protein